MAYICTKTYVFSVYFCYFCIVYVNGARVG